MYSSAKVKRCHVFGNLELCLSYGVRAKLVKPWYLNVALFSPEAFAAKKPDTLGAWFLRVEHTGVEFVARDLFGVRRFAFPREQFLVKGALPSPAF